MIFDDFLSNLRMWGMEFFGKFYGPYRARVISNKDPKGLGRIKIACPRARITTSDWILPMMSAAGVKSGEFWPPEPSDTVWVFFDNGDPSIPASYLGGWYAQAEVHPNLAPEEGKAPMKRGWASPGGHTVVLDDTSKEKNITITTNAGHKIILDDSDGKENILIRHKNGKIVKITAEGKVRIGKEDGSFEPMMRGSTVKRWLENHTHPHSWGPTAKPIEPFPADGLSDDSETS